MQAGLCFILGAAVTIAAQAVVQQLWRRFTGLSLPSRGLVGPSPHASNGHSIPTTASSPTNSQSDILLERVHFIQVQLSQVLVVLTTLQKQLQTMVALREASPPTTMANLPSPRSDQQHRTQAAQSLEPSFPSSINSEARKPQNSQSEHDAPILTFFSRCSLTGYATYSFDIHPYPLVMSQPADKKAPTSMQDSGAAQARAISVALRHISCTPYLEAQIKATQVRWLSVDNAIIEQLDRGGGPAGSQGSQALQKEVEEIRGLVKGMNISIVWQLATKASFKAARNLAEALARCGPTRSGPDIDKQLAAAKAELIPPVTMQDARAT